MAKEVLTEEELKYNIGNCPKSFKTVQIEQECCYGLTNENLENALKWECIKDYAYIKHGRPIEDKDDHVHLMLRFKNAIPTQRILAYFNKHNIQIEVQHLCKCYKWNGAIAYLTHENVDKPKYDRKEVISNYDFENDINQALEEKKLKRDVKRAKEITEHIVNGEIKVYRIFDYLSVWEYHTYKKEIDNAIKYRNLKIQKEGRSMECIYIQGGSGLGKTTMAKEIAKTQNLDYFISSGSNDVLDGYMGEPCIILDDLRASCMNLSDLLKMLDNNTSSTVKSRFYNKALSCKLIIITSIRDIEEFFSKVFENDGESKVQLLRRCKQKFIIRDENWIDCYYFDKKTQAYKYAAKLPNIYITMYDKQEMTQEEMFNAIQKTLGGYGKTLIEISENMADFAPVKNGAEIPKEFEA